MDVAGKKVTVVGMGHTSMALVRLLLREGAQPFVTEIAPASERAAFVEQLETAGVPCECGGHSRAAFSEAAIVIPSPGVRPAIEPIQRAVDKGAKRMGEMEFAFQYATSPIIAVTGTNGKTTTTELIRSMVTACGHSVLLAGNNARPFSAAILEDPPPEYFVLEVSSYQLETVRTFRPWIGVVLNVSPDHLARHPAMEDYAAVKAKLFENQEQSDHAVVNVDDPWVRNMADSGQQTRHPFSTAARLDSGLWLDGDTLRDGAAPFAAASDTLLPGRHNLQNVLAALSAMKAAGFPREPILEALRAFKGVEHRIEHVAVIEGVPYFNDSKSTNIDSLKVALESFDSPVVLIAGGRGKGSDYSVLAELVAARVSTLVTLGEDAPLLEKAFGSVVPVVHAQDMDDAVLQAAGAARRGHAVLLSPGCASFDLFDNFEQRGHKFKECVRRLEKVRTLGQKARKRMKA